MPVTVAVNAGGLDILAQADRVKARQAISLTVSLVISTSTATRASLKLAGDHLCDEKSQR